MSVNRARGWRRLLVCSLIAQQMLLGAGIPLPFSAAAPSPGESYPCQGCGCGCRSAEQCWKNCCCFSNRQKVAWARQHGVAVPAFVVAAAGRETTASRRPECRHCDEPSSPRSETAPATPQVPGDQEPTERGQSGLCWLRALGCQGQSMFWQAAVPARPANPQRRPGVVLPPAGRVEPQPLLRYLFLSPAPPTPPPKPIWAIALV
jgi:hypothetical protein